MTLRTVARLVALAALLSWGPGCRRPESAPPPPPPPPPPPVSAEPPPARPPTAAEEPPPPTVPAPDGAGSGQASGGNTSSTPDAGETSAKKDGLPAFEWPPPEATGREEVPAVRPGDRTYGEVAARLTAALDACGYTDRAWYAVPGGFALATRLEQIRPTGEPVPPPDRWAPAVPRQRFSLTSILRALVSAPRGEFRVVVLTVTPAPVTAAAGAPSRDRAERWLHQGAAQLDPELAGAPLPPHTVATALVYQFEKPPESEPVFVTSGSLTAHQHLAAAGLLAHLGATP